ncbi:DUF4123 domain-containing protein [Pseudomonas sp. S75]|uniref:DUF4123 domain-containing protein n=1 Tax=unclassified Pseudomonas TaxID=196821 RepID=UPI0019058FDD|nr:MULTISPECIES: DUF4123 domain-containing protein [unclassified Pseudomonas]MBJ9978459.1 DUF4123 domain-containing protein [Pseudomonas sp. S30]MBK0156420.1 DUF4123 domain-containing protein [Pseudomonas sp. S75]
MRNLFTERLLSPLRQAEHYRLSAVLELSQLSAEQLESLGQREHGTLYPLMQQYELNNLRQIGAALYNVNTSTLQGQSDFFWELSDCAADALCGWIISSLPTAALAAHLAQANTVRAPDGQRYLLRYHTEQCLRVLHARTDLPGITEWFAPIHSWWVPYPDANEETWCCVMGGGTSESVEVNGLALDPACWEALAADPLEHRLADQLKGSLKASRQTAHRHSVRLGRVRKYLAAAREAGFVEQQDLITYVTSLALLGDGLTVDPRWQAAIDESLEQGQPLAQHLHTHLNHSLR